MLIYLAAFLYIIIHKGAMLCARVRVIVRACDPMGPRARARGIGDARACGSVRGRARVYKRARARLRARGRARGRRCEPWPLSEAPRRAREKPQPRSRRNPTPMASRGLSGPLRGAQQ